MRPWCPGALVVVWWWQDLHSPFNILSLVQQWITNKQLKVKEKEMFKSLQVAISWWGGALVLWCCGGGRRRDLHKAALRVAVPHNLCNSRPQYGLPKGLILITFSITINRRGISSSRDKGSSVVTIPTHLSSSSSYSKSGPLLAASYSLFSGPLQELGYLINVKKKA